MGALKSSLKAKGYPTLNKTSNQIKPVGFACDEWEVFVWAILDLYIKARTQITDVKCHICMYGGCADQMFTMQ